MLQGIPQSVKAFRDWRRTQTRPDSRYQGGFVWSRETQVPSVRNPGEGSLRFGAPQLQIEIQATTTAEAQLPSDLPDGLAEAEKPL
jgi:hypothetical protein